MKRSRAFAGAAALGALVVLSVLFWLGFRDSEDSAAVVASDRGAQHATEVDANVPKTSADIRTSLPPLPPTATPIDQAAPVLAAHARAGNPRAACRLAFELLRCRNSLRMDSVRHLQTEMADAIAGEGDIERAIHTDEATLRTAENAMVCRNVEAGLHVQADAFLVQAAQARIPYAMYLYGTGEHIQQDPGFAATPEFDAWRRAAPGMMIAARDAGIPDAASFLALAYSNEWKLGAALFADDPVQASAHWHLMSLLRSGQTRSDSPFLGGMDASDAEAGLQRAHQLHARAYGGRLYPEFTGYFASPYALSKPSSEPGFDCQGPPAQGSIGPPPQAVD